MGKVTRQSKIVEENRNPEAESNVAAFACQSIAYPLDPTPSRQPTAIPPSGTLHTTPTPNKATIHTTRINPFRALSLLEGFMKGWWPFVDILTPTKREGGEDDTAHQRDQKLTAEMKSGQIPDGQLPG